jgi:autotransporter-associated beta strand protein
VGLVLTSDGSGTSGLGTTALAGQTVAVTGYVYSGKAQWAVAGSGIWSSNGNWSDTQGSGGPGTPGVAGYAGDTATFGSVIGNNAACITLDTPVTLSAISFSNTAAGGYTLSGSGANTLTLNNSGSGATITVADGSHVVSAPVVLADNLTVSGSGTLAFGTASSITDNGSGCSLTMSGTGGTLILGGSNAYGGGTNVNAGTLEVLNSSALPEGTSLTVGASAPLLFGDSLQAAPPGHHVPMVGDVQAVPEAGTLALLGAAVCGAAIYRGIRSRRAYRRRRKIQNT